MADKMLLKGVGAGVKPVPMKLFASWEVEKTSPNCIPRLCSLTLNRLIVLKPLENDLNSVIVAVRMQSSKRVLRSNEIMFPSSGLLDTELDLTFSLQYPHFLKRDGNKLQIMLQRRKKYKNRTILGYKTLAMGQISMSQVLQRSVDRELNMYSDLKERTTVVAQLLMVSLSSQPVDHGENGHRKLTSSDADRSPDVDNDSDDDEPYNFQEDWSNDDMSDSEPIMISDGRTRPRKSARGQIRPVTSRQRNIKQKFIALLKRFKVSEEALDSEADHDLGDPDATPADIDELIDELEDLSDSGPEPELDTLSVISTPKPRLRPFFTGRSSTAEVDLTKEPEAISDDNSCRRNDSDNIADPDSNENSEVFGGKPKSPIARHKIFGRERSISYVERKNSKERHYVQRRNSTGITETLPRKVLLEQLSTVLDSADDRLPASLFLVNTAEWQGQLLVQKLQEKQLRLICTCSNADVKAAINFLVTKIQKFCNSNSKNPSPIKVGIAGGDGYINTVLRPYVEQFSARSPDWQNYVRFFIIPFGGSSIGKQLAGIDNTYSSLFMDTSWKDTFDKPESPKLDQQEVINRVSKYLSSATGCFQVAVSEAMVMYKSKSTDEETSQIFIPFLSDVSIGSPENINTSVDLDEGTSSPPSLSSSPPSNTVLLDKPKEVNTPPSSPNVGVISPVPSTSFGTSPASNVSSSGEYMELQVDYWTTTNKPEGVDKGDKAAKKDSNKLSLKSAFKSLHVHRSPYSANTSESQSPSFSMTVVIKEKKQKIIRLGKKAKEMESKSQLVEWISRLLCTSKSQNCLLKVTVDGVEWPGVKFFQLSSQWQTHIKHFPVAMFVHPDANC